jgi:hypothetical protein
VPPAFDEAPPLELVTLTPPVPMGIVAASFEIR